MQALARDQVRRYSEGHGFGKASGPHTIYLTLTLIALIAPNLVGAAAVFNVKSVKWQSKNY